MVIATTYRFRNVKGGTYLDEFDQHKETIHGWSNSPQEDGQKWVLEPAGTGWRIKNVKHGLYASGVKENGAPVKASSSQDIWILKEYDGGYAIYLKDSDYVIDLYGGKDENGTGVRLYTYSGVRQQLWEMEEVPGLEQQNLGNRQRQYKGAVPPGTYRVHSVIANTALDLYGGGTDENTAVLSYSVHAGPNQNWTFESGTYGYRIKNVSSGTYLGFKELSKVKEELSEGKSLSTGPPLLCHSQPIEWTVTQADKGYQIHWAENQKLVIDLSYSNMKDGALVVAWYNEHLDNQKWRIEAA